MKKVVHRYIKSVECSNIYSLNKNAVLLPKAITGTCVYALNIDLYNQIIVNIKENNMVTNISLFKDGNKLGRLKRNLIYNKLKKFLTSKN